MATPTENRYDLIVIGSGIGGLVVASLMAQIKAQRVLVLEQHFKLGGLTHSFTRPGGRRWDVGLHYVGEMGPGEFGRLLLDLVTRAEVRWQKMPPPFETFLYPDLTFEVPDDKEAYQEALIARFPREKDGIRRYFADVGAVARWLGMQIVLQAAPAPVRRLAGLGRSRERALAFMTTAEYLRRNFADPRLKALLASQWGDYGLPPGKSAFAIHALIVAHYLQGGYYPVGGAQKIAERVARIVEEAGGRCLVNHRVEEILVRKGTAVGVRVKTPRGVKAFHAPRIVSDTGAYTTYARLLPPDVPLPFRDELEHAIEGGKSFVTVYLGLKESPEQLGFKGGNYWIFADYDHDMLYRESEGLLEGRVGYCFLSFPSLKDPAATAPTAEIITTLDPAAVMAWRDRPWLKRGDDYMELKRRIGHALIEFVDRHRPGFKDLVDYWEVSTPVTIETFTGHPRGAAYGLPATPDRFRYTWLKSRTPVKHLYLTGADAGTLGVLGAAVGGLATSAHLLGARGFLALLQRAGQYAKPS